MLSILAVTGVSLSVAGGLMTGIVKIIKTVRESK